MHTIHAPNYLGTHQLVDAMIKPIVVKCRAHTFYYQGGWDAITGHQHQHVTHFTTWADAIEHALLRAQQSQTQFRF